MRKDLIKDRNNIVKTLREQGKTIEDISQIMKVTKQSISKILQTIDKSK